MGGEALGYQITGLSDSQKPRNKIQICTKIKNENQDNRRRYFSV